MSESQENRDFPLFSSARPSRGTKQKSSKQETSQTPLVSQEDLLSEIRALGTRMDARLDTIDGRLDSLSSNLSSLCAALTELTDRVTSNESRLTEAEGRISTMEDHTSSYDNRLTALEKRTEQLQAKVDDLENRGRRKNIKIVGLPEKAEGSASLTVFLREMLPKWLDLPPDFTPEIERAHRSLAPAPSEHGRPRSVLVRFLRYPDKETILRAALQKRQVKHGGAQIRLYQDLSAEVLRRRREFSELRTEFAARQMFRGFAYPAKLRCLHNGKIRLFSTVEAARDFLISTGSDT